MDAARAVDTAQQPFRTGALRLLVDDVICSSALRGFSTAGARSLLDIWSKNEATQEWISFNLETLRELLVGIAGRIVSVEGTVPAVQNSMEALLFSKNRTELCCLLHLGKIARHGGHGKNLNVIFRNAPYILGIRAVALPIAAENTVVLKGSELSTRVMLAICSVFAEARLPAGPLT
ncbi:unnamed protein product [Clonostachys rosea]|uniref:Aldehyde dehydrogenase domain-containing protein n=1 Tax=Bionectria ochroleuca TaxID=29856 RepID=A0ABY6UJ94_BIOOC|nr:unnamed protein product [Clonostachys rosea]